MLNHFALAFSLGYGLDSKGTLPTLMGKLQYIGILVTTIIISCPPPGPVEVVARDRIARFRRRPSPSSMHHNPWNPRP